LSATTSNGGPCHEANPNQSAFVEATVLDPATGALSVYHPLVVDQGTQPASPPVLAALPANAVVGIWFGFNGTTLTLAGSGNSLGQGNCVNGLPDSPFGQFAYCNAPAFFNAASTAIGNHQLVVPALGKGNDGLTCPTIRDFGIVDQDQSDNLTTTYLALGDGRTAQANAANAAMLPTRQKLTNASDNRLLNAQINSALGCTSFTAPDLTDGGNATTSLALDELQAAVQQAPPVALVPLRDPMAMVNNNQSVAKTNLYRAGVGQPAVDPNTETPLAYCQNLMTVGQQRLMTDRAIFQGRPSPAPDMGQNLYAFLLQRFQKSLMNLGCGTQHGGGAGKVPNGGD
jgi:hypothetical protein